MRVRTESDNGQGPPSNERWARSQLRKPWMYQARVGPQGDTVTLFYGSLLQATPLDQRALESFQVTVNRGRMPVSAARYNGTTLVLTMDGTVYAGDHVRLTYQPPVDTGEDGWALTGAWGNYTDARLEPILVTNRSARHRDPLLARWTLLPQSHSDLETTRLDFSFSEPVRVSRGHPKDHLFQTTNAEVLEAWPVGRDSSTWQVTVQTQWRRTMVLLMPANRSCS